MSVVGVRTGSSAAPQSVRRGVIRRRLRWASRVGMVLVLALVLSVVGAIRSNQQAQALVPMLAPAAPVLAAAGPPGWAVLGGAGVLLGGVYLAEKYRDGEPDQSPIDWFNGLTEGDAVGQGIRDWFNNTDGNKAPSKDAPTDPNVIVAAPSDDFKFLNWRETTSSGGNRQLTFDIDYVGRFDGMTTGYGVFAKITKQCRLTDGRMITENVTQRLAHDTAGFSAWKRQIASFACASGKLSGITFNPLTEADWKAFNTSYPQSQKPGVDGGNNTYSIVKPMFYYFKDHWSGTTGTKTTIVCEFPNGTKVTVSTTAKDGEAAKLPDCGRNAEGQDGVPDSAKVERTNPDGSVHPTPIATADYGPERPVGVVVDGQPCTMGRADCANWSQINQTQPERVQCLSGGVPVHVSNCNSAERFYENGGTVVHPHNIDGDPNTYWDPRQDPNWTPLYPVQDGGGVLAPAKPGTEAPPRTSPDQLPWTPPTETPTDPDEEVPNDDPWEPYRNPSSPLYDERYDTNHPDYDPVKDPSHEDYDKRFDPKDPDYDPRRDPSHEDYDPYWDPDNPLYDPDYDPDAPDPEPSPEPTTPAEPEPTTEPSQDPEPEPTTPAEPEPTTEPSQEPTTEPGEGEDPEPSQEPTEDPSEDPSMEPQPGESQPPIPPPPTAVGVDEFGHLMGITATTGVLNPDAPGPGRTYVQPATGVRTVYAPDGTTTTTFTAPKVETPTGTQPLDLVTVTAPDGTKTTTGYPSVPKIETPGSMVQAPPRGTHPPIEVTEGTCTTALCVSIPEPPEDMMTRNCMKGGWSWNPIDWVKTPVVCALREAFEPNPDKLDANVQKLRMAFEARGFDVLIKTFETTVTGLPGGGGGCMGPPITAPLGGESHTFYFFQACDGAMANVATYVNYFIMLASGLFGMIAVIRNIAFGFGHTVKIAEGGEGAGS